MSWAMAPKTDKFSRRFVHIASSTQDEASAAVSDHGAAADRTLANALRQSESRKLKAPQNRMLSHSKGSRFQQLQPSVDLPTPRVLPPVPKAKSTGDVFERLARPQASQARRQSLPKSEEMSLGYIVPVKVAVTVFSTHTSSRAENMMLIAGAFQRKNSFSTSATLPSIRKSSATEACMEPIEDIEAEAEELAVLAGGASSISVTASDRETKSARASVGGRKDTPVRNHEYFENEILRRKEGRPQSCSKINEGNILAPYRLAQFQMRATNPVSFLLTDLSDPVRLYLTHGEIRRLVHDSKTGLHHFGDRPISPAGPTWGELIALVEERQQRFGLEIQFNNIGARLSCLESVVDCVVNGHLAAYESRLRVSVDGDDAPGFCLTLDAVRDLVVLELVTPPIPSHYLQHYFKVIGPEVVRALSLIQLGNDNPGMRRTGSLREETYHELEVKYSRASKGSSVSRFDATVFNAPCPLAQLTTSQRMTDDQLVMATEYQHKTFSSKNAVKILVKAAAEYVDSRRESPSLDTIVTKNFAGTLTTRANKLGPILKISEEERAYLVEYREGTDPPKIVADALWRHMSPDHADPKSELPDYSKPIALRPMRADFLSAELKRMLPWVRTDGVRNIVPDDVTSKDAK